MVVHLWLISHWSTCLVNNFISNVHLKKSSRIKTRVIAHAVTVTAVSKTAAEMVTPTEEAIAKAESFGFGVRGFDGIHITTEVYGATKPVVILIPRMVIKYALQSQIRAIIFHPHNSLFKGYHFNTFRAFQLYD